jgi:hypothetical protein
MKKKIVFLLIFLLTFSLNAAAQQSGESNYVFTAPCGPNGPTKTIIVKQPNGPFAAIVFPEDALGNYLGIIYYDSMNLPENNKWSLENRFWQGKPWASDITSIAWGPSGKFLYVATDEIYGDGGLFQLDLYAKTYQKIFPTEEVLKKLNIKMPQGYRTEIKGLTDGKLKIKFESYWDNKAKELDSGLPIK